MMGARVPARDWSLRTCAHTSPSVPAAAFVFGFQRMACMAWMHAAAVVAEVQAGGGGRGRAALEGRSWPRVAAEPPPPLPVHANTPSLPAALQHHGATPMLRAGSGTSSPTLPTPRRFPGGPLEILPPAPAPPHRHLPRLHSLCGGRAGSRPGCPEPAGAAHAPATACGLRVLRHQAARQERDGGQHGDQGG